MDLRFTRLLVFLACCLGALSGRAETAASPQVLRQVVEQWLGERDQWAFTQRAIEFDNGTRLERLERFDPTRQGNARWELLAINGSTPTPQQRQKWAEKKFKRRPRKIDTPFGDYLDFRSARVLDETAGAVRFEVPLNREKNWLLPVDKVSVLLTLNKHTQALQHVEARVREPFKVLLGIARVNHGELAIGFVPANEPAASPTSAPRLQPEGIAHISVHKFGERVDFTWSDFRRVVPARQDDTRAAQSRPSPRVLAWLFR